MASLSATCIFAVLLLLALAQISLGISCYQCGKMDSGCNDPFDTKLAPKYACPCPSGSTTCIKVVNPNEYDVSVRGCGGDDGCDDYARCYSCKGDLCNSSSSVVPSFLLVGLISLIYTAIRC